MKHEENLVAKPAPAARPTPSRRRWVLAALSAVSTLAGLLLLLASWAYGEGARGICAHEDSTACVVVDLGAGDTPDAEDRPSLRINGPGGR